MIVLRAYNMGKKNPSHTDHHNKKQFLFRNLSFELPEGEIWGINGPSGCGKTTLLRCLRGLEPLDEGGYAINERQCGFVFQDYQLFPHLNIYENLMEPALLQSPAVSFDIEEKMQDWAQFLDVHTCLTQYPHTLSGGQKQRIAFMRALLLKPKCLLLDEATSALDIHMRDKIKIILDECCQEWGMSVLLIAHDPFIIDSWLDFCIEL